MTGDAPFARIRDEILRRIRDREWRLGDTIPGELQLAEEFGCARATVGKALAELADLGVVERRRRAGTRVAAEPVRQARFAIPIVRQEVEDRGQGYRHVLLLRERAPAPVALRARFDLADDAELLHLRCLHLADDRPFRYEDRWINLATVPDAAGADFAALSPNEWLVREVPYTDGEFTLSAEAADAEVAELLDAWPGMPVFVMERATRLHGRMVTLVRLVNPPGYRLSTSL